MHGKGMTEHKVEIPDTWQEALAGWGRYASDWPAPEKDELPGDALNRDNAARCKAILTAVGLQDLMDGNGAVDLAPLRDRGQEEDSAPWIAALWLGAYNRMLTLRREVMCGNASARSVGLLLIQAQELGRLQERLWWRAGVDPSTGKRREALAVSGRRQVKGGHDGNLMKGQKSFASIHGEEAQAMANAIASSRPSLTWAAIRATVAREFGVSPETIKKALRNPKKVG